MEKEGRGIKDKEKIDSLEKRQEGQSDIKKPSGGFLEKFADSKKKIELTEMEKRAIKKLKKKPIKKVQIKEKKPSIYVNISNKFFADYSEKLIGKGGFKTLERELVKANMRFITKSYVSIIFFTTLLSFVISIFILMFFLFFNIGAEIPFITMVQENLAIRFIKIVWIVFLIPIFTFFMLYFYPTLEKQSIAAKINNELPFATVNMSAISGSMIEPSKIFRIIVATGEYPNLSRELIKLLNEINILGNDLITALRNSSFNTPSKKLAELFNGIATTINSGGNLPIFFNKRSETLLFEYRIEREKYTRSSETFMDIYISVVIAAPMIFMLLLMMIKISGLGIPLSTSMISLLMVLGVSGINIVFLVFLHLKQPAG